LQESVPRRSLTPNGCDLLRQFGSQQIQRLAINLSQIPGGRSFAGGKHESRKLFPRERLRRQQM